MMNREHGTLFLLLFYAACHSTSAPPEGPRTYEAESSANTLSGSAKASDCRPCSGGKNVGYIGGPGDGVLRFNGITAARDQDYVVTFYYSNGSPHELTAFAGYKDSSVPVVFRPSGGWTNIASVSVRLHLAAAGANSIDVFNHQGHYIGDIDRIVVAPAPSEAMMHDYEAESAANTFQGTAKPETCSPCSGGKNVGNVGGPGAGVLKFNGVEGNNAGNYLMTIRFSNGSPDPLTATMCVNGSDCTIVKFPTTGQWSKLSTVVVPVRLHAGKNTVRFSNASGYVADIDKITIQDNLVTSLR
jgi:alpha-galactosidase